MYLYEAQGFPDYPNRSLSKVIKSKVGAENCCIKKTPSTSELTKQDGIVYEKVKHM